MIYDIYISIIMGNQGYKNLDEGESSEKLDGRKNVGENIEKVKKKVGAVFVGVLVALVLLLVYDVLLKK